MLSDLQYRSTAYNSGRSFGVQTSGLRFREKALGGIRGTRLELADDGRMCFTSMVHSASAALNCIFC